MPSEGENDHETPIALCKRKGIRGYDADPDVRRRSCDISGNNTLGSMTGLSERKSWRVHAEISRSSTGSQRSDPGCECKGDSTTGTV
jgi:hypothetical protein